MGSGGRDGESGGTKDALLASYIDNVPSFHNIKALDAMLALMVQSLVDSAWYATCAIDRTELDISLKSAGLLKTLLFPQTETQKQLQTWTYRMKKRTSLPSIDAAHIYPDQSNASRQTMFVTAVDLGLTSLFVFSVLC